MAYVISKAALFPKVAYAPNPAQRKIHECCLPYLVTAAGRRTGKSTAGGKELIPEAYKAFFNKARLEDAGHRAEFWVVGPEYSDSEKEFRSFWDAAKRLQMPFDKPGTYYNAKAGDLQVSLWGGRFLLKGMSAKHPEHLVGEGLHGVIMAEAAKMKERVWQQMIFPTLADFRGWAKFNSTPEGRNWFYDLWNKGQKGDPGWANLRFPSWFNTAVFPLGENDPMIQQWKRDMSPEMFDQEVRAQFGQYVGRVFKQWDEEWHVRRMGYDRSRPVFLAADYGWTNPNVLLFIQVDPWQRVHVVSEYYQSHRDADEIVHDLEGNVQDPRHRELWAAARNLYPDPEDPKTSFKLAELGHLNIQGNTGGELKTRLELIRKWLKDENDHLPFGHEDRIPRLTVDPSCKNMIREMDAYRYPKTQGEAGETQPEHPLKKDDHTPEALGRFMRGYFGEGMVAGPPRQKKMRTSRTGRRVAARR